MENQLFLIINSILNKKIFYANKDSLVQKSLNELSFLYLNYNKENMVSYLNIEDKNNILFNSEEIKNLKELLNISEINPLLFLKDFNLSSNELLKSYSPIIPINNNLPFNSFSSITVDKEFLNDIDLENYSEIRKKLLPIIQLIQDYQNQGLFLSNLNIEFSYTKEGNKNIGYCSDNKIFVDCNALNSSIFHHEYFHSLDKELTKKLNIKLNEHIPTYSELNIKSSNLTQFNCFIQTFDKNISNPLDNKNNLKIYFNKYFSKEFNEININELKEAQLRAEIENFSYGIYTDGKGNNKYQELDNIIKEFQQHIDYAFNKGKEPKRKLFSIISEAKDLGSPDIYFSKKSEKLARIYQSQFHIDEDNKIFPLGSEKILITQLNEIIRTEFKLVLNLSNVKSLNNIIKIRKLDNNHKLKF